MPHIIVEYSSNLEPEVEIQPMIAAMHKALSNEGVDAARIKSRAIALDHYVVGDKGVDGAMVHITLLLLEGRDEATKKQYSTPIHQVALDAVAGKDGYCAVTLEVRDMDAATYIL
ncbi:MAG: 5-carboxymethyl-2-hydroxymuconate isomerase [Micavibrio sp.]|nr:5-carboxymethyl-2-hydroxymuconate isomerase [Micavibrio sp.]